MSWASIAEDILEAMENSGVEVVRKVIAPGPAAGLRCRTFLVHPTGPQSVPFSTSPIPGGDSCAVVDALGFMARFTVDCFRMPGDAGQQPDADATTAKTLEYLNECQRVWNAIIDAASSWGCRSVTIGAGVHSGPSGGVATMSIPITVMGDGLPVS